MAKDWILGWRSHWNYSGLIIFCSIDDDDDENEDQSSTWPCMRSENHCKAHSARVNGAHGWHKISKSLVIAVHEGNVMDTVTANHQCYINVLLRFHLFNCLSSVCFTAQSHRATCMHRRLPVISMKFNNFANTFQTANAITLSN